jgi:hypothetical protein
MIAEKPQVTSRIVFSSGTRPLAAWKFSSVVHLRPAAFTKMSRGTCRGV